MKEFFYDVWTNLFPFLVLGLAGLCMFVFTTLVLLATVGPIAIVTWGMIEVANILSGAMQ